MDDVIGKESMKVLLTHGTHLTSISAGAMCPGTSVATKQCKWKELTLSSVAHSSVEHLAYLPLHSVTKLTLGYTKAYGLGVIELPLLSVSPRRMPALVRQAATNLAACPAWKNKPSEDIHIWGDPRANHTRLRKRFTPQQLMQLLEALTPLSGSHLRELSVCIEGITVKLGQAEMQVGDWNPRGKGRVFL
jgi:hypothetical protein